MAPGGVAQALQPCTEVRVPDIRVLLPQSGPKCATLPPPDLGSGWVVLVMTARLMAGVWVLRVQLAMGRVVGHY